MIVDTDVDESDGEISEGSHDSALDDMSRRGVYPLT